MKLSSIETHCIAAIGVIGAALAAIHPGFHLPADTSQIATGVFSAGAVIIEGLHRFFASSLAVKLHLAEQAFASVQTVLEVPAKVASTITLPATHAVTVTATPTGLTPPA